MLEKKQIIIIVLIIAIIIIAGLIAYTMLNQTQYQTIQISNGTTIEVPKTDDATWSDIGYGIKSYSCPSKHFVLTSFNSGENTNIIGAGGFAIARDALLEGAIDVENYKGYQIKENTVNDTHFYIVSAGNDTTHDNIIIGSEDLGMLKHALDTLHFGASPEKAAEANIAVTPSKPVNKTINNEAEYGGYSMQEYYYKMGLADGHEQAYWNGYSDGYYDSEPYDYDGGPSISGDSNSYDYGGYSSVETTTG